MISFSVTEDRYGVVQKDLAEVISTLFALEKVIRVIMCENAEEVLKANLFKNRLRKISNFTRKFLNYEN